MGWPGSLPFCGLWGVDLNDSTLQPTKYFLGGRFYYLVDINITFGSSAGADREGAPPLNLSDMQKKLGAWRLSNKLFSD